MHHLFRDIWNEHGQPVLTECNYTLQVEIASQKPSMLPDRVFLPYLKSLGSLGYAHVIIGYSARRKSDTQRFSVQLLRYDGTEPYEAYLCPRMVKPRTYLAGYLPHEEQPPLPLLGSRTQGDWCFRNHEDLPQKVLAVRARLAADILPWLEDPTATQFVKVEKAWYVLPFEQYLSGVIDAPQAYALVNNFRPEGYFLDAGTIPDTALVSEIHDMLRSQVVTPNPAKTRYMPPVIEYLRACLNGTHEFNIEYYRRFVNHLFFADKRSSP